MIYLDSSVALAQLLTERRTPGEDFWRETLVASRLLEYEIWTRIHARGLTHSHSEPARDLLRHVEFIEMTRIVLSRVLEPLPTPVRALDAMHLATIDFLRRQGNDVALASYDKRLLTAAAALDIAAYPL